ncbi:MAG: hypothetical protein M3R59_05535 [Verrucomicrobiota bacterium]|nr:hypothetical protein [Verrucomicrobiota bacterium]
MNTPQQILADALRRRRAIIVDENSRRDLATHTTLLQNISEEIDRATAALPQPVPGQLAHYLQRHSYDKALAFLEEGIA